MKRILSLLFLAPFLMSATASDLVLQPKKDGGTVVIRSVTSGGVATDAVTVSNTGVLKVDTITNAAGTGQPVGGVPAGMIMPYAGAACPTGWLAADGSVVSQTTYANLFAAISTTWDLKTNPLTGATYTAPGAGNFRVPSLAGVFLRGVADYSGADAYNTANDVALGAYRVDQFQGHEHTSPTYGTGANAANVASTLNAYFNNNATLGRVADGTNGTPRTGYETAPKQVGVTYCVKY